MRSCIKWMHNKSVVSLSVCSYGAKWRHRQIDPPGTLMPSAIDKWSYLSRQTVSPTIHLLHQFTFFKLKALFIDVAAESALHSSCVSLFIELLKEPISKTQPHTLSVQRKKGISSALRIALHVHSRECLHHALARGTVPKMSLRRERREKKCRPQSEHR
jgi:hypothetical protein